MPQQPRMVPPGVAVRHAVEVACRSRPLDRCGPRRRPAGAFRDGRVGDTIDTEHTAQRQRFLAEQGHAYAIVDADDMLGPSLP